MIIFINFSCFEQNIIFNSDNKSGFINYKIILNNDFYRIIQFVDDKTKILEFISIITEENKIRTLIQNENYLKLSDYKKRNIESGIEIYISFYFSDKEKISFQFKDFIFPISIVEENKIIKARVILSPSFLGDPDKLKIEYRYFIPKIIDAYTFENNILPLIKSTTDKDIISKLYTKTKNNNYIFESKYPNIEKFKNNKKEELITVSKILSDIKFNIKEKEFFNSYGSLIKFKFLYKLPKMALVTPQSQSLTFSQTRKDASVEYSLIEILSSDRNIEFEVSYRKD